MKRLTPRPRAVPEINAHTVLIRVGEYFLDPCRREDERFQTLVRDVATVIAALARTKKKQAKG